MSTNMIHLKKLMSLFVAVAMLMQMTAVFAYDDVQTIEESTVVYTDNQKQIIGLMTKLGAADDNLSLENKVTRAQFVSVLVRALGKNDIYKATEFWDLPEGHEYYNDVGAAVLYGFVEGYGEKVFMPDKLIDSDEAIAILLNAMGFKDIVAMSGKYPENYRKLARKAGMNESVLTYKETMTGMEMYELLYEAFDANVCIIQPNDRYGNSYYTVSNNETLLSEYRDIYKTHGIMNSNTKTALRGFKSYGDINIGGTYYAADSSEFDKYLCYDVDFYYYSSDSIDSIEKIFYVMPRSQVKEIIIKAQDVIGLEGEYLTYNANRKVKKANIAVVHNLIFNGQYKGDYDRSIFKQPNGTVRLVSTAGNGIYDAIFIETFINTRVKRIDVKESTIKLVGARSKMKNYEFRLDDGNTYEFISADGTELTVDDLTSVANGSVISIMPADFDETSGTRQIDFNSEYVKFVICTDTVEGRIDSIYDDEGVNYVKIGDESYIVSVCNTFESGNAKISDEGVFYQDHLGELVDLEVPSQIKTGLQWGYLINASYDANEELCYFKILTADAEIEKFEGAEDFRLNGKKKDSNLIQELLSSARRINAEATEVSQPIQYELNNEGYVKNIQTVLNDTVGQVVGGDKDHIRLDTERKTLNIKGQAGNNFIESPWGKEAGKNVFAKPKITFRVPNKISGDEYYDVITTYDDSIAYSIEAYNLSEGLVPEMAVAYVDTSTNLLGLRMFVKTEEKLDDDGEPALFINCTNGNSNYEYKAEDPAEFTGSNAPKRGDLVNIYGIKSQNIATNYVPVLKVDDLPSIENSNLSISNVSRSDFGEAYFAEGNNIVIQNGPITTEGKRENVYAAYLAGASIVKNCILYDDTEGGTAQIRKATINDIKPSYLYGGTASLIYSVLTYGELNTIVVYNISK